MIKLSTATETTLFLEDLTVEEEWISDPREITAEDVADFAALTGDHDPLHESTSGRSPFGEPVAHGLLGLSILAGLSSDSPRVATLALVELGSWKFEAPIFFGDSVRVRTRVTSIEPHGRRAARVVWHRELLNQDDRVVQQGTMVTLVASASRRRAGEIKPR